MSDSIRGGYYLKARRIENSAIAHAPPHAREVFDYFLRKAFWKDGDELKRGQLLTNYKAIRDDLRWYVGNRPVRYKPHQIETATKLLARTGAITKARTTRGLIVTVCNYDLYQSQESYENHSEPDLKTTREPRESHPIDETVETGETLKTFSCSEPDKPDSKPETILSFAVKGGGQYLLTQSKLEEYVGTFDVLGKAGVLAELKQARQWLLDNPKRIKTTKGMPKFLSGWLLRSVGRNGGRGFPQKNAAQVLADKEQQAAIGARLLERPAGEVSQAERMKQQAEERAKTQRAAKEIDSED